VDDSAFAVQEIKPLKHLSRHLFHHRYRDTHLLVFLGLVAHMMSQNREDETDMIAIWSVMAKVIEESNDPVSSRIDRSACFLLDLLQHVEFEDVELRTITI
jgi:hypothetical protein